MNKTLPLYQAFDALFPIGSYAMSGGMETYTQSGIVSDRETLAAFLKAQLYILPYGDVGVAAKAAEGVDFVFLDGLCAAMKHPCEIRMGSQKLCSRFLKVQAALSDNYKNLADYRTTISEERCYGHYPVAIGLFVRDIGVAVDEAMGLYCYSILSLSVNHAVKLIPLGQSDGQSALFEVMRLIPEAVERAIDVSIDDLGVSGYGFDLRAMKHEILKGRLYSS